LGVGGSERRGQEEAHKPTRTDGQTPPARIPASSKNHPDAGTHRAPGVAREHHHHLLRWVAARVGDGDGGAVSRLFVRPAPAAGCAHWGHLQVGVAVVGVGGRWRGWWLRLDRTGLGG